MLFVSQSLAARLERAECRLLTDGIDTALRRRPEEGGIRLPVSGGVATVAGSGSPLNKVAGLGFGGPLDEDAWRQVEQAFAQREEPVRVELSTLADPSIGSFLTKRGYALCGFENVLGRPLSDTDTRDSDREIDVARDVAVVTTQPGSKSQQNAQRFRFEMLYTRAVLVLEEASNS